MKIRLGYACISTTLDITTSSTITYTNFLKNEDYNKINDLIISNLKDLKELLTYNIKNNIHFFRMSSNLIPLATKEDVVFDYIKPYKNYYKELSKIINENNLRVDFHLPEFCVLNSTRKEVIKNSINIIEYHYNLLKEMDIKNKVLVLHIGSSVFGKDNSIIRFINNFNKLPDYLKKCIVIENDDKIYNIEDCLKINNKTNIPIVLDYHHHICNYSNINFKDVFNTWNITPKVHFSSPKSKLKKEFRSHNDYINSDDFIDFINSIKDLNIDIDIMIEAKKKDDALFKLVRELKYKTNYKFIDDTTFII